MSVAAEEKLLREFIRRTLTEGLSVSTSLQGGLDTSDLMRKSRTHHSYFWAAKAFVHASHADGDPMPDLDNLPEQDRLQRDYPSVNPDWQRQCRGDMRDDGTPSKWDEYTVPEWWGW